MLFLAPHPSFILLDEHACSKNRGIGVIITDHNVQDTLPIADYGYILYNCNVLVEGTPEKIINSNKAREIYLGVSFVVYNFSYGKEEWFITICFSKTCISSVSEFFLKNLRNE